MSSSEISVPMEISAASFTSCSTSSGRISEKSVEAAFVLNPKMREKKNLFQGMVVESSTEKNFIFFLVLLLFYLTDA